jgi:hypothetical protein
MSVLDEQVDVDLTVLEDLEFAPACEMRIGYVVRVGGLVVPLGTSKPCGEPAVSLIRCRVCGKTAYICEAHRAEILTVPAVACGPCRTEAPALQLFEFTPIGGA